MSKYTAEQVESAAEILEQGQNAPSWRLLYEMLRDYADLLRERESAKAAVTDGWPEYVMLRDTGLHDDAGGLGQRIYTTAGSGYKKRKYILEAVAPMLASARVPEGYTLHLLGTEPDETKYRLISEDIECFHRIMDDYGAPREADGKVLSMFGRAIVWRDQSIDAALSGLRGRIQEALATAPKPETEE